MKNLQSTIEGTWIELKQVKLTQEQIKLMMSRKQEDKEAIESLRKEIKNQKEVVAEESDALLAQEKYESIKPVLEENQEYQLIEVDCHFDDNKITGILNCRINGEHKQIRF